MNSRRCTYKPHTHSLCCFFWSHRSTRQMDGTKSGHAKAEQFKAFYVLKKIVARLAPNSYRWLVNWDNGALTAMNVYSRILDYCPYTGTRTNRTRADIPSCRPNSLRRLRPRVCMRYCCQMGHLTSIVVSDSE